jgi:hypothetical protein
MDTASPVSISGVALTSVPEDRAYHDPIDPLQSARMAALASYPRAMSRSGMTRSTIAINSPTRASSPPVPRDILRMRSKRSVTSGPDTEVFKESLLVAVNPECYHSATDEHLDPPPEPGVRDNGTSGC